MATKNDNKRPVAKVTLPPATPRRPYTLDRVVRLLIAVACVVGAVLLINKLKGVLLPFVVAWVIAYILEPVVQFNRRLFKLRGRLLAVLLSLLEAILVVTALCVVFVPTIIEEVHEMANIVRDYADHHASIPFVPSSVHDFLRENIDWQELSDRLSQSDMKSLAISAGTLLTDGLDLLMGLFSWLIMLLYVVFIMLDYDRLSRGLAGLIPPKYRRPTLRIWSDVTRSMDNYFRGQGLVSMFVGIIFAVGFAIIGLPLGIVLGLCIGVMNMVPYLQLISIIPCTLLCLVYSVDSGASFWTIWWECMALYCICQAIQDLFLTPKIMGKYMGLNPAVILLSLSVWGTLLGFIGLIIALPLTTLLLAYYHAYIERQESAFSAPARGEQ